jgi:phosphoribosyl 1,2-cyclic phosphodiesterase
VDCGFPAREIERRLASMDVEITSLDAILVTHEHHDHVRGLGPLARRYRLPTWMTYGTYLGLNCGDLPDLRLIEGRHCERFFVGDLEVSPYTVPHDSREPCQFVFRSAGQRLGLLTDAGHVTPHVVAKLQACDSLILEFNHDTEMLAAGPYPPWLQARVGGHHGHLNNHQAVELLSQLNLPRLQHLVAAHLSEQNNSPQQVAEILMQRCQELENRLSFASQEVTCGWHTMTRT